MAERDASCGCSATEFTRLAWRALGEAGRAQNAPGALPQLPEPAPCAPASAMTIRVLACWVRCLAMLRHPARLGRWCFLRSYALALVLRRRGLNVELNVGIDADPSARPCGHAWLSRDGMPILEWGHAPARYAEPIGRRGPWSSWARSPSGDAE